MPKTFLKIPIGSHDTQNLSVPSGLRDRTPSESGLSITGSDLENTKKNDDGPRKHSLTGLLASKRFAKAMVTKVTTNRNESVSSLSKVLIQKTSSNEPTYRLEPVHKFQVAKIAAITEEVVKYRLDGYKYNAQTCSVVCSRISETIKEKVKKLNFDRYKIVTMVIIGEHKNQGVMVSSRCAWDEKRDNYVTFSYQKNNMYCTVTVFGVYAE